MRPLLCLALWLLSAGSALAEPQKVNVGIFLNNIIDVDLKTGIYTADFYIWFRWKGDLNPVGSMEFINTVERWGSTEENLYPEPISLPSGEKYQLVRVQGKFTNKFPLHSYPLDNQEILVTFEDIQHARGTMVYVPDLQSTQYNPEIRLPGWNIDGQSFEVEDYRYPTDFGLPKDVERTSVYSRMNYRVHLSRPVWSYTFKMLLPVLIVLGSTFAIFWLAPSQVDSRVTIGITALLSAVALNITVVSNLPLVGYQVLVDKIYNLTYIIVFLTLLATIQSVRLLEAGDKDKALKLDRICYRLFPSLFLLGTFLLIITR